MPLYSQATHAIFSYEGKYLYNSSLMDAIWWFEENPVLSTLVSCLAHCFKRTILIGLYAEFNTKERDVFIGGFDWGWSRLTYQDQLIPSCNVSQKIFIVAIQNPTPLPISWLAMSQP